jgi:hypothetical protein
MPWLPGVSGPSSSPPTMKVRTHSGWDSQPEGIGDARQGGTRPASIWPSSTTCSPCAPSGIGSRAKAMRSSSLSGPRAASLFLGEGLDAEHIEADYEHGVLTVTIPVAEQAKPRKVEIASGGKAQAIETGSR